MSATHPILYSYRRCPYAMRARMGIYLANLKVEQREIVFWDKPAHMLELSPKGTVPVLLTKQGDVIDESRDILSWAMHSSGLEGRYYPRGRVEIINAWIDRNDGDFKHWLDRYKYADRFPEHSVEFYRAKGCEFLQEIENALTKHAFLVSAEITAADIAIFPFVRQFINVNKTWWQQSEYKGLKSWFKCMLEQAFFTEVMKNRPPWAAHHQPLWVIETELKTKDHFTKKALGESA